MNEKAYCTLCGDSFYLADSFDLEIYCPRHRSKANRDADRGKTIVEQDQKRAKGFEKTLDPMPDEKPQDWTSRTEPKWNTSSPTTYLSKEPGICRFCKLPIVPRRRHQTLHPACKLLIVSRRRALKDATENIRRNAKDLGLEAVAAYLSPDMVAFKDVSVESHCPRCWGDLDVYGREFKRCSSCRLFFYWVRNFGPRTSVDRTKRYHGAEVSSLMGAMDRGKTTYDWTTGSHPESTTHIGTEVQLRLGYCDVCEVERELRHYTDGPASQRSYWGCTKCGTQIKLKSRPIYLNPRKTRDMREFGQKLALIDPKDITPQIAWTASAGGNTMIGSEQIGVLPQGNPIFRTYYPPRQAGELDS